MGSPAPQAHSHSGSHGALNVEDADVVRKSRRSLLADSAPEALHKSLYRFLSDPVLGAFSINVLAAIFVKLVFFVLWALLCGRAKKKEQQQLRARDAELREWRTLAASRMSSSAFGTPGAVVQAVSSVGAQSNIASAAGSTAAPPVVDLTAGSRSDQATSSSLTSGTTPVVAQFANAGFPPPVADEPDTVPTTSSTSTALPTESKISAGGDQDQKGPRQQLRKRNGIIVHRSPSSNLTSTFSCESPTSQTFQAEAQKAEWNGKDGPNEGPKDYHVVNMPVQFTFPEHFPSASLSMRPPQSGNADRFKAMVTNKLPGVSVCQDVASSRVMQASVPVTEENLRALRELAIEGMKLDRGFTLQIGGSFLYYCNGNPEEPALLSLSDVEVPTILQVEYSAGMLIISGRYLEGAEIRAATSQGYMIFESVKQDPINNNLPLEERIGVWRCTDLLPPVRLDRIQIFASKSVPIVEGHSVTVRSEVSSIQSITLRTIMYKWVPTIVILNIFASQIWVFLRLFYNMVTNPLHHIWFFYPTFTLAMYIIHLRIPRFEEVIKDFMERLKLAISSFHVFVEPLDSPAFIMRNGLYFQRGAKYLINFKSMVGGLKSEEGDDKLEELPNSMEELTNNDVDNDENLEIKRDWNWPCWKKKDGILKKLDLDSNIKKSNGESSPFEVIYGEVGNVQNKHFSIQYLPKDIVVKLHSQYLQDKVKEWLPKKLKLFEKYGEIQAKDLFILYIKGSLKEKESDMELDFPSTSNDISKRNNLHMFHLKRFLEKEYEVIIKEYNRMMEAGTISWDMLWTLIVPEIDIIYYCCTSEEELCGNVCFTNYVLLKYETKYDEFAIDLEVYNYDCNNFKAMKTRRKIMPFQDEVKIIDLNVFPLEFRTNSHELEEYFLQRGKTYCNLVLKYERQYMHYHGVMYDRVQFDDKRSSSDGGYYHKNGIKASVEGRVMIDQIMFAKMKPKWNMDTAQGSAWLRKTGQSQRKEMRAKAMANGFDSVLKYSPAIVYGYSFSMRKWRCFNIEGFSKIHYTPTAFDKLVMNEENKLILLTLTEYYIKHPHGSNNVGRPIDLLPNKGEGCIIVLHGPPGTGKTLTVESLAEKLECPLWQLSISKLTQSTKQLENKMLKTFEVAKLWGAILVLDEADVYLSSRKYSPLSADNTRNNAMTGVFLRVLEYYKGILFLTTNVMNYIEPAIFSRISLFIKYVEFNKEDRKKLWNNFLNEIEIYHLSEEFWKKVLPTQFNGRVIRNIIQNAQILMESKDFATKTTEEHLLKAFDAMAAPSTMRYLVDNQGPIQSSTEGAPSIPSAQTLSSLSDLPQVEERD